MQSFVFYTPTEIVFGKGEEEKTGQLVRKHGGNKVFIVYGGGSVIKSGLMKKITDRLEAENTQYIMFGGVQPNPLLSHAREGVKSAVEFGADFILAVGGGSVIDTAKAIAHGTKNPDIDIWKFWKREIELTQSLPVGVVLTISAAGSETSNSAVLTNAETGEKRGLGTDFNRPRFAVMNPELTYSVPKFQVACGIADIMMHTIDRYFAQQTGENEFTDAVAESLLRNVIKNGPVVLREPANYDAVSEVMWCGSVTHNGMTGLGRPMDFSVHQLGHELSGRFDVPHGASLSTMWGSWAQYVRNINPTRFAKYAKNIWDVCENDTETAANAGIAKTVEFFKSIGMPTCFTELGIGVQSDKVIDEMADSCVFHGKRLVGNFKPLDKNDVVNIYKLANR
ncbi:MAG: iron-containing alcohol dehydrogenase [Oscillospiraceae bacterium]|nr:iron-containing alcohol dehydrogenase [Oscillospiraceae bacterium]